MSNTSDLAHLSLKLHRTQKHRCVSRHLPILLAAAAFGISSFMLTGAAPASTLNWVFTIAPSSSNTGVGNEIVFISTEGLSRTVKIQSYATANTNGTGFFVASETQLLGSDGLGITNPFEPTGAPDNVATNSGQD